MTSSNVINNELKFTHLYKQAISLWPNVLELDLIISNSSSPNLYTIRGLGLKKDEICAQYLKADDEILMLYMHDAIFFTIRTLAAYTTKIDIMHLRESVVKTKFEEKLVRAKELPELRATKQDILMVQKYFETNTD